MNDIYKNDPDDADDTLHTNAADSDTESQTSAGEKSQPDTMKRRGFFEAARYKECPQQHLTQLLKEYETQARERLDAADAVAAKRIEHLTQSITNSEARIAELKAKLDTHAQYQEAGDTLLQDLLKEKEKEEQALVVLRKRLADTRQKLSEAKAGIVQKSLEEAETQVRTALGIQKMIYDETWDLNQKKFNHEKAHLSQLASGLRAIHQQYTERYEKVNKYLRVLDVDGISPITTKILATVGTVSFGAAGFFFSTFAGNAGFGNQDFFSFLLQGIMDTAKEPLGWLWKVLILAGLIALVTLVSIFCNVLLNRLKRKSEEDVLSEIFLQLKMSRKFEQAQYGASLKSNNWYAFWLQLVPVILIAGLMVLGVARNAQEGKINVLSSSSEGLIIGAAIALSFSGLIYLYIIKIVEPRLLKWYDAQPGVQVKWMRANWELATAVIVFIIFTICVIFIPYNTSQAGVGFLKAGNDTRYAILLFISVCLVGSISFAYSVRSRGLIQTSYYIERVLQRLNNALAYCSCAEAPELHNTVAEEHSNIIQHVLRQLTFKASIHFGEKEMTAPRKGKSWLDKVEAIIKQATGQQPPPPPEPFAIVTALQPWEQRYFPHIEDELKVIAFEYSEQQKSVNRIRDKISDHRDERQREKVQLETEITDCRHKIETYKTEIEATLREKAERLQRVRNMYNKTITDLMDGFHLGMWYRENGMGPKNGFYESCPPSPTLPLNLIAAQ
jgi:hypothetical protein